MASRRWYRAGRPHRTAPPACAGLPFDATRGARRRGPGRGGRATDLDLGRERHRRGATVRAAFAPNPGVLVLSLPLAATRTTFPGIEDLFPAASRMQRAIRDISGVDVNRPGPASMAATSLLASGVRTSGLECRADAQLNRGSMITRSCESKAMVSTRFRSVLFTLASSSQVISVFPSLARRCSSSRSVSAMCTRASSDALRNCHRQKVIGWPRVSAAIPLWRYAWAYCQALEGAAVTDVPPRAAWLRALALEVERICQSRR